MKRLTGLVTLFIALNAIAQQKITNPVLDSNFPDPTVIQTNGKYYAYATNSRVNGRDLDIQVASSTDLQDWTLIGDALPQAPSWERHDFWAPRGLYDKALNT
jgi:beta-xylosidase